MRRKRHGAGMLVALALLCASPAQAGFLDALRDLFGASDATPQGGSIALLLDGEEVADAHVIELEHAGGIESGTYRRLVEGYLNTASAAERIAPDGSLAAEFLDNAALAATERGAAEARARAETLRALPLPATLPSELPDLDSQVSAPAARPGLPTSPLNKPYTAAWSEELGSARYLGMSISVREETSVSVGSLAYRASFQADALVLGQQGTVASAELSASATGDEARASARLDFLGTSLYAEQWSARTTLQKRLDRGWHKSDTLIDDHLTVLFVPLRVKVTASAYLGAQARVLATARASDPQVSFAVTGVQVDTLPRQAGDHSVEGLYALARVQGYAQVLVRMRTLLQALGLEEKAKEYVPDFLLDLQVGLWTFHLNADLFDAQCKLHAKSYLSYEHNRQLFALEGSIVSEISLRALTDPTVLLNAALDTPEDALVELLALTPNWYMLNYFGPPIVHFPSELEFTWEKLKGKEGPLYKIEGKVFEEVLPLLRESWRFELPVGN